MRQHPCRRPLGHPPSLAPTPSHTPTFTLSYSTGRHCRVGMSSGTYMTGLMSSCASSAPAREPAPWHHQLRNSYLVHSHKRSGMRGSNVYHYGSRGWLSLPHLSNYHMNGHVASRATGRWVCNWDVVASGEVTGEAAGRRKAGT